MGLIQSIRKIMLRPDGDVSEASTLSETSDSLTIIQACARTAKLTAQAIFAKMSSGVSPVGVHNLATVTCSYGASSAPPYAPLPLPDGINVNNIDNYNISYRFWMLINQQKTELVQYNGSAGNCLISVDMNNGHVGLAPMGISIPTGQLVWVEATVTKK